MKAATPADLPADRPLLGIALMAGFCLLAPLGDSFAKLLGPLVPLVLLLTIRFAFQAVLLVAISLATGRSLRMARRETLLTALRTLFHILGIGLMFAALRHLPLADAVAIAFVMPFILLLLGWALLGEEVGPHRLGACAVGFLGTLMVIQPNFAEVGALALLPLGVAFAFAGFILVTRAMARQVDAIAMQGVSGVMAMAVLLPALAFGPDWEIFAVTAPPPEAWPLIVGMGLIGTFGHLLMTWSLRFAPAATLAPMQYLEIPVSAVLGLVIFGDLPDGLAALGILVTIAAGLYVVWRERRLSRTASLELPAPPVP